MALFDAVRKVALELTLGGSAPDLWQVVMLLDIVSTVLTGPHIALLMLILSITCSDLVNSWETWSIKLDDSTDVCQTSGLESLPPQGVALELKQNAFLKRATLHGLDVSMCRWDLAWSTRHCCRIPVKYWVRKCVALVFRRCAFVQNILTPGTQVWSFVPVSDAPFRENNPPMTAGLKSCKIVSTVSALGWQSYLVKHLNVRQLSLFLLLWSQDNFVLRLLTQILSCPFFPTISAKKAANRSGLSDKRTDCLPSGAAVFETLRKACG